MQWRGFSWLKSAPTPAPESRSLVLEAKLTALAIQVEAVEKSLRDINFLRLEWAEVLDKLQAWTNRQSARDAKYLKVGLRQIAEEPSGDTNGEEPSPTAPITKIELRRALAARLQANRHMGGGG